MSSQAIISAMRDQKPPSMRLDGEELTFVAMSAVSACRKGDRFVVTFNERVGGGAHLVLTMPIANAAETLRNLAGLAADLAD